MGYLKSHVLLPIGGLVFEKIALLHFCDRQADGQTKRQTDGQPKRIKPLSLSRVAA